MRTVVYTKPGLELAQAEEPELRSPREVKIRVSHASLCGSDLHMVRGDFDRFLPDRYPMGHEAAGVVVELGSDVAGQPLSVGDAVTFYFNRYCGSCYYCRDGREQFCSKIKVVSGFMSDYVVVDRQQVFVLPADASLLGAALIEPTSVALRGVDLAGIVPGRSVAVFGGGGVGQIVASLARLSGSVPLALFEPIPEKREVARRRGVDVVADPLTDDLGALTAEMTGGRGFDVVIETSGAPAACQAAMEVAGKGATVEFLATYPPTSSYTLPLGDAFMREITLVTGVYQSPYMFPRAVALTGRLDLEELATVFQPRSFQEAFDAQRSGTVIKSVIDFN